METDPALTWNWAAMKYPEFVQWIVQTFGPLPEGPIKEEDWTHFVNEYQQRGE